MAIDWSPGEEGMSKRSHCRKVWVAGEVRLIERFFLFFFSFGGFGVLDDFWLLLTFSFQRVDLFEFLDVASCRFGLYFVLRR